MNPIVQQLIERAFGECDTIQKSTLLGRARSVPLPGFVHRRLQGLPDGPITRRQVEEHLGVDEDAQDTLREVV